jgi:hypothetical protein
MDDMEREWEYEVGDIVVKENEPTMPGAGPVADENRTEYEILKRLSGADDDEYYYYLAYDDGHYNLNQLFSEGVLSLRFEKVGEVEDGRYDGPDT